MRSLTILTILAILLLGSCTKQIEQQQYINSFNYKEATPEQIAQILNNFDTTQFVLIDLRNPHDYALGHLKQAINIPAKNLYDKKYRKLLKSDKIKLAYGYSPSQSRLIASFANHVGYKNFYAVLGNYEILKNNFVENYAIHSAQYDDEKPLFNYKQKFAQLSAGGGAANLEQNKPKPVIKVPVKKKQVGGGCE